MRVWLDDIRDPTSPTIQQGYGASGDEVWVKTVAEALDLLRTGKVKWISLDHDLGEGEPEGHEVSNWIEENAFHGTLDRLDVYVHSDNTVEAPKMRQAIRNANRFWDQHAENQAFHGRDV